MCAAPKKNKFWLARAKHGRDRIFSSPATLWETAVEFFEWTEKNLLKEQKVFQYQGEVVKSDVTKMRAMTLEGFLLFAGIGKQTWYDYKARDDFSDIISRIEMVMYDQKFTGAAADLLNANIIARDLGLKDKQDISSEDGSMTPRITEGMSAKDAALLYKQMVKEGKG